jgi:2-succinyl-6-hydroxy-2,4-cyclohexadiene-1-carboxylate synthase
MAVRFARAEVAQLRLIGSRYREIVSTERLATESVGSGSRVVLVHGFTQTGRSWSSLVDRLASDYEVVTVDAPGHGDSGDIRANLTEGAALLGHAGGRASYVGYSMGARLCLHLALDHPELVERLVILGATGGLETESEQVERQAADEQLARALERDGVDAFLVRWLANPLFERLPHDESALNDRRRNTVEGLASSLRLAGTGTQEPLWSRLHELQMPVLVLAGEHDPKFRALGERIAESICSNATVAVIPNAGHPAHLEQPAAFMKLLSAFICSGTYEVQSTSEL